MVGRKKKGHAHHGALSNAYSTSVKVDYNTCCSGQCNRWTIIVLTYNCPMLPELTSSKHFRIRCFWSLIAILHPGCLKLLCHALQCICGPQTCPNIIYKPIQYIAGSLACPPKALPIMLHQNRSPAHCTAAKLQPAHSAMVNLAALPTTSVHFHSFTQIRPILQHPGGLRHALLLAKVAICCKRILGSHPLLSCVGKALGFDVVSLEAGGHGQGLCLNRWNGMGPATDSLDHRAGVCYLLCSLWYNELQHAINMHSLSVPPSIF